MGFYGPKYPGKLTVCYGKWPIERDGLPIQNGDFLYVKLPEGTWNDSPIYNHRNHRLQKGSKVVENY